MLTLAIESSTRRASVALQVGSNGTVLEAEVSDGTARIGNLMSLAQALFEEARADPRQLTHVLVGTGPGSYTGLRIGVSLALGLAVGPRPPALLGVPSCDALLSSCLATTPASHQAQSAIWLSDARAGTWYQSAAAINSQAFEVTSPATIIAESDLAALLASKPRVITDEPSLASLSTNFPTHQFEVAQQKAKHVLHLGHSLLAQGTQPTSTTDLAPLYLREFAAKVRTR